MKMREGGVSCGQKRLLEEQRLARKTKTFETQRKGGSRGKELLRALVALLALMIRSDLHQTFYFLASSRLLCSSAFQGFHSRIIKLTYGSRTSARSPAAGIIPADGSQLRHCNGIRHGRLRQ